MNKLNIGTLSHIVGFLNNEKCICYNCEFENLILCNKYYLKTLKPFVNYTKPFNSKKYESLFFDYKKEHLCPKHFMNFTQEEIKAFEQIYDELKNYKTIHSFIHIWIVVKKLLVL